MKIEVIEELNFSTARSGGKGGQNVNKVETMVEGRWHVATSALFSEDQKQLISQKLSNRITADGFLLVKSQTERSQLGNKHQVIKKINQLIEGALVKKKSRIATKPSKGAKEKRIQNKKNKADIKMNRQKITQRDL